MRKSISIILIAFVSAARLMAYEPEFYTLKYQYRHYEPSDVPVYSVWRGRRVGSLNLSADFPVRLYTNFQRTEFYNATSDMESPCLGLVVDLPSSDYKIFGFLEGTCDYDTGILATVNPDGTIFDTLEAEIKTYTAKVLEFTINEKYEIVTYSLTPTDPEPLPFYSDKFCNENGNIELIREDTTYKVVNGRFVKICSKKYRPQVYPYRTLSSPAYHIRNGNETPCD